jgi:hypothetical protein
MSWFTNHLYEIVGFFFGLILLIGGKVAIGRANDHAVMLWFAYIVRLLTGLIFGASLYRLTQWVTSLPGTFGGIVSSIGAIIAVIGGWIAAVMTVRHFRDLADGKPDGDARTAALWVPILGPACFSAVWQIITNPRGIGTGITAAIIAIISVIALHQVVKSCLKPTRHELFWKWVAVAVSVLGGILMIPLLMFADSQVAAHASSEVLFAFRALLGAVGLTLLFAAVADAWPKKSKNEQTVVPDKWVRAFCAYGVPVLFLFGAMAFDFATDQATKQGEVVTGSVTK